MGNLALILSVVIHHPHFLCSGAGADEVDFGFGNAVDAAAEARDDFVGKVVGDFAGRFFGGGVAVFFAEDLRAGGVAGVVEIAVDSDAPVGGGKRAEGDHAGAGRGGGPLGQIHFLR